VIIGLITDSVIDMVSAPLVSLFDDRIGASTEGTLVVAVLHQRHRRLGRGRSPAGSCWDRPYIGFLEFRGDRVGVHSLVHRGFLSSKLR